MSHAEPPRDASATDRRGSGEGDGMAASRVVLMELAEADGPLSLADLIERTLLSRPAVAAALADLVAMAVCRELSGDDRRPTRYALEESPTDHRPTADG